MVLRRAARLALAVLVLSGGASLGLAQDQDTTPPGAPPPVPGEAQNAVSVATPSNQLDIPPPEEAPPPSVLAPELSETHAPTSDTAANVVADTPQAVPSPPRRPHYASVVLQALDKVTAETLRFEAKIDEPVRYKDLVIIVHACETQASDEPYAQTAAHLEVQYQPEVLGGRTPQVARQVFRGWMFGDAPGLHPFEHPIYDVWVIACKTPSAAAAPAKSPAGASL